MNAEYCHQHTWQTFNNVFPPGNAHDGHSGHLSYPAFEVSVVGGDYIDFVLHDSIDNAVVCIDTLMVTLQPLPTLVSGNSQCYPVPGQLSGSDFIRAQD